VTIDNEANLWPSVYEKILVLWPHPRASSSPQEPCLCVGINDQMGESAGDHAADGHTLENGALSALECRLDVHDAEESESV
jgi:hypothetical protein